MTLEAHNLTVSGNGTLPRVPFLALKEKVLGKHYELSIAFVSSAKAQKLNMVHRNKDYVPNTLSFSLTKTAGEIILCTSALRTEYKKFAMTYNTYLIYIIIHSMLHLKGMEHGRIMESKEKRLLTYFTTHETTNRRRH